jgi:putative SOS response-associated peptidase YedK
MCNLYAARKSAAEIAQHFGVRNAIQTNAPEEVYPGQPGLVEASLVPKEPISPEENARLMKKFRPIMDAIAKSSAGQQES